ncbi:putative sister chromatid cohesion protein Pds5 [Helianthus annuus]|nr:putative sister chromatid cohesion protein Pds5 [Helianthus annuus]
MVTADGDHGEISKLEFRPQPKVEDAEIELRRQLKEAGRLLSKSPDSVEELLFILDQLWRLLLLVDQSPNNAMQDALSSPTKALVAGSLLEHPSMDVKVSVASCLCEVTRITAPDAPYTDEELKGVFRCIVSSLENLSDESSRFYNKRVSIIDSISKVRSCIIMLDLECFDLIVKMFEHFLNTVRDHHHGIVFSSMVNIMALVLEESEDISLDMLKPLLKSVKNIEGVLPVARELGEEVIKKSADKIRPYLNKAMTDLNDSLAQYSQVVTSVCEGTPQFAENNAESASVHEKVVDTASALVSSEDAAPVTSNGDVVIVNEENVDAQPSKNPEEAVDVNDTGDTNDTSAKSAEPVVESVHVENTAEKSAEMAKSAELVVETVHVENTAEKSAEIVVSVEKTLESEVTNAPTQSGSQQEESQPKVQIKKGIRSKKKGLTRTDRPLTVVALTTVNEVTSDPEMRSPKRIRKLTEKAEENNNKPSVTTGDSGPKPAKRSRKKVGGGGSVAKKPKVSGEEVPESKKSQQDDNKEAEAGGSKVKPAKRSRKKANETDSAAKQPSGKKVQKSKVITKSSEDKDDETDSDNTPLKSKQSKKKSKQDDNKEAEAGDSKVKPAKRSRKKDNETDSAAKQPSGKMVQKSKVIKKPSEEKDIENKDEETDSDNTPLKPSENKEEETETDSDRKIRNVSENRDEEETETDSDNIPLKLSAQRVSKSRSSVVKSRSKIKDGRKQGRGKNVEEKNQTKSLSEDDDGMDVSLQSVLKKATKVKGNLEGALSTGSKRKRSVTKKKVTETIKYDDSLVGQKVKVWWPEDKMYYEGVVESFNSAENKHKVLYVDGDEETLNLRKEKWEFIKEFSTPNKEVVVAVEVQNTDILPDMAEGENKVSAKEVESKADKATKKDDKKATPKKMVYSRGKKGSKTKTKTKTKSLGDNVKESGSGNAAEEPESVTEKSTETPKTGSKTEKKNREMS